MTLLRFLLCLLAFIGTLVAAGVFVISILLMLRFPPLLISVTVAVWLFNRLIKLIYKGQSKPATPNSEPQLQPKQYI